MKQVRFRQQKLKKADKSPPMWAFFVQERRKFMIYGNDLSHHQSADAVIQLAEKGKAEFLIFRTGFGTYSEDKNFARYIRDSEEKNIPKGIYHASYAGTVQEAVQEADFCIGLLEETGAKTEMPVFFDYEYFSAEYNAKRGIATTPQLVQELTTAFCERVKQRGYRAGVYFNRDYLVRFYTEEYFKSHPDYATWYARPGYAQPDYQCDLWQYASDDGAADFGYRGAIDKNILMNSNILLSAADRQDNQLQEEISRLEKALAEEKAAAAAYKAKVQSLTDKTQALSSMLAAEKSGRKQSEKEKLQLKDKLDRIKQIIGG